MCPGTHYNNLAGRPEHLERARCPLSGGGGGHKQWYSPAPLTLKNSYGPQRAPEALQLSLYSLSLVHFMESSPCIEETSL